LIDCDCWHGSTVLMNGNELYFIIPDFQITILKFHNMRLYLTFRLLSILLIFNEISVLPAYGQSTPVSKYISMAFIKSKSPDFTQSEEIWSSVHSQLIKEGKKVGWYLYRVKYPVGSSVAYDYVRFNVFTDWKQVEAPYAGVNDVIKKVYPAVNVMEFNKKTDQTREVVWEQLFQVIDEATNKIKEPSKFIVVNQMKTVKGEEGEYVKLERTYFKPFHVERVARGVMNNWGLYKPAIPYGEKYEYDYVTLNGFSTWDAIIANNPPDVWKKVHGEANFDEIHNKILAKRITVNNELWELVAFAVE